MFGQILLALVGVGLILLSIPYGATDAAGSWWGVLGGALIVVGAVVVAVRRRRPRPEE
ncbi:LPXTG cell wall anchor domain-containing protein [Clavibacter michiganensis]|uniref:LPXTG cell wall anchor domain-containing protein n=1 Tax=Clavibacter michiganensis TaxID=28447 RepID=UPI00195AE70C|nr:LPXTG cell wall anchor domain-containing protein [Clavibacter michiganensis]